MKDAASQRATIAALICFAITIVVNVKQTWWLIRPRSSSSTFSLSLSGEKTRSCFLLLLFGACAARLLTLGFLIMGDAYVSAWSYDLLVTVPSIIMLSSFSVIALFWAQVYYTSRFMVLHHSQFVFWFLNIGVYSILFVVAAMTKLLAAFEELRVYNAWLLSALFLCVGVAFSLYGLKVAFQFSGDSENRSYNTRKSAVIRRVLLLSTITPLAFWARGIYEGAVGIKLIGPEWRGYSIHFWDAIMIIASEWFPAQLVLALFWPPRREHQARGSTANRLYQTDPRMPLLDPNCGTTVTGPTIEGGGGGQGKDVLLNFVPQSIYPLTSPAGGRYP